MNNELQSLITQHLDGHLDAAGQRRLAAMLDASLEARQTLACYLRLEGAAIKLAAARQLAPPSAEPQLETADELVGPQPSVCPEDDSLKLELQRKPATFGERWTRIALMTIAASLLAALVLSPFMFHQQADSGGEIDLLAENWLRVQTTPQQEDSEPTEAEQHGASSTAVAEPSNEIEPDDAELEEVAVAPPSWMVAAMAELADENSNPAGG